MIRRTFQLTPGVGPWREKDLWARGVLTWDQLPGEGAEPAISRAQDAALRAQIGRVRAALEARDLAALAALVPPREHWRLYPEFREEALYFDIECDGGDAPAPTVVTALDADGIHTFIQGRNLDELPERLGRRPLWVSFNGTVYDVPVLRAHFGAALPEPAVHLDLRFFFRKLGRGMGLKALEDELGLSRPPHLCTLNGLGAVDLWRQYRATGDVAPLRLLVEYNAYDAINLRGVLDRGYNRAVERLAFDGERIPEFERGDVLYDLSRLLLALEPTGEDLRTRQRLLPQDRQLREEE
ncbi:MAG TPA: ribonuclease H-like domain-containing protein [Myxococcales bacterium]|nr:ribonuclease H-like domain-containing protein [Myxococcales bacterium]